MKRLPLVIGLVFTALVVGTIIALHLGGVTVPRDKSRSPSIVGICTTAPEWVHAGRIEKAASVLASHGYIIEIRHGVDCRDVCSGRYADSDDLFTVPCLKGMTIIDLRGQDARFTESHGGQCLRPSTSPVGWGVIRLPSVIPGDHLQPDAETLILVHELLHCVGGYRHVQARVGCLYSPVKGHILHPNVATEGGWSFEGLQ